MSLKFEAWLTAQHERQDFIGVFARGLKVERLNEKLKKGKSNEHSTWVNIVLEMQQMEYVTTFNIAWQEFLQARAEVEAQHTS